MAEEDGGYGHIQGTRPQTLAYGLQDSPVGLMSWIAEKFDRWTDARGVSADDVLTTVMIYWVTGSIGSSFWPYWTRLHGDWVLDDVVAAGGRIAAPLTYLDFPKELVHVPRTVVERVFDIERWETPAYGGHFPALETTDVLADSLRALLRVSDLEDLQRASAARRLERRRVPHLACRPAPGPSASRSRACPPSDRPRARRRSCRSAACPDLPSSTSTQLPKPTTSVCVSTSRTSAASSRSRMRRIFVSRCAWSFLASWYSEFSLTSPTRARS